MNIHLAHNAAGRCLLFLFFIAFTLVFLNVAWVADDAFITFRAVDNFLKGYGPVWNVGERVQVYTHPLWYALLIVGIGLFKHHYWVTIALSYVCLMATIYLLLRIAKSASSIAQVVIALFVLLLSRAFMDYSSSGLENPLLHLLLACYVLIAIRQQDAAKRFLHTSLLYSLVFLTRPDGIFIITPVSLWMLWQAKQQSGWKHTLILAAIAAVPAVAWEAFSLIYYGSLVPNTALAKVNIDYPRAVLLEQARKYFSFNLRKDPVTLVFIILSITFMRLNKNHIPKLLMAGVVLQMIYIGYVGADYMQGRFLSPSMLTAAIAFMLLTFEAAGLRTKAVRSGAGILLVLLPWQYPYNLKYSLEFQNTSISGGGIADERGYYHQRVGLIPVLKKYGGKTVHLETHIHGGYFENKNIPNIGITPNIGIPCWSTGEKPHWIDINALAEPYLSRLPARSKSRVGHYERILPQGYLESLVTGNNAIANPVLAKLYDDVALATRGELWSRTRWRAIWRLNTGRYKKISRHFNRDDQTPYKMIIPSAYKRNGREFAEVIENGYGWEPIAKGAAGALALGVPPAFSPFIKQGSAP